MSKANAAKAEAQGTEVTFEYGGNTYTIQRDLDLDTMEFMEDGKIVAAIRGLLGPDQYAVLKESKPKASDISDFMAAATAAMGFDSGESRA